MNKPKMIFVSVCVLAAVIILHFYGSGSSLRQEFLKAEDAAGFSESSAIMKLYDCLYGALMNQYGEEGVREVIALRMAMKNGEKPSKSASMGMMKLITVSPLCGPEARTLGLP